VAERTDTKTLADALDVLAREIESGDGIANAAIAEAAQRLRELEKVAEQAIALGNLTLMVFPDGSCAGSRDGGATAHMHGSGMPELAAYLRGKEGDKYVAEAAQRLRELECVVDDACAYFVAKNRASMGRTLAFMADTNPHFKQAVDAYLRGKEGPDA
jgi:hypothetical protein